MMVRAATLAAALTFALIPTSALHAGGEVLTPELAFGDWTFNETTGMGSLQVTWNSDEVLAGFQFDLPDLVITDAGGGLTEEAGFAIAFEGDRILAYFTSMDGFIYPTDGTEVLIEIDFEINSDTDYVRFDGVVCAAPGGTAIKVISDDEIDLSSPPCVADLNGDGFVDGADLTMLLASWGPCSSSDCAADFNGDGAVDGADLTVLLATWGVCL